jgi:hypothetical protein
LDFGQKLFPDLTAQDLTGTLYAYSFGSTDVERVVTEREYLSMVEEEGQRKKAWMAAHGKEDHFWYNPRHHDLDRYSKWESSNVLFDDITEFVNKQIQEHNRLVIVLQGLFDRSPVFQPHTRVQLWTPDGFSTHVKLVYDDSRALTTGDKPDFEAYRTRLNATLKVGSLTVGQEDVWLEQEAARENRRRANDYRLRANERAEVNRYRPYDDPGPGLLARTVSCTRSKCGYTWLKERRRYDQWGDNDPVKRTVQADRSRILNVDAYTPGDFKQFFADPRTRADYLQWAPLLLEAEEWHAKNRSESEGRITKRGK